MPSAVLTWKGQEPCLLMNLIPLSLLHTQIHFLPWFDIWVNALIFFLFDCKYKLNLERVRGVATESPFKIHIVPLVLCSGTLIWHSSLKSTQLPFLFNRQEKIPPSQGCIKILLWNWKWLTVFNKFASANKRGNAQYFTKGSLPLEGPAADSPVFETVWLKKKSKDGLEALRLLVNS